MNKEETLNTIELFFAVAFTIGGFWIFKEGLAMIEQFWGLILASVGITVFFDVVKRMFVKR